MPIRTVGSGAGPEILCVEVHVSADVTAPTMVYWGRYPRSAVVTWSAPYGEDSQDSGGAYMQSPHSLVTLDDLGENLFALASGEYVAIIITLRDMSDLSVLHPGEEIVLLGSDVTG